MIWLTPPLGVGGQEPNYIAAEVFHNPYSSSHKTQTMNILQFGGGNFIRAFAGTALRDLNLLEDFSGRATVVKPTERGDYAALREQNGRYHLAVRGVLDGTTVDRVEVVDVVDRVIHPYRHWEAFLATATEPDLRVVVSNTTESGIRYVSEPYREDACPTEFPAKLCRWLYARYANQGTEIPRRTNRRPAASSDEWTSSDILILPCELIEANGDRLKECILKYASDWQLAPGFTEWINASCYFANTLVDQIVSGKPAAGDPLYDLLEFPDELPVVAEPYHLWVIQADPAVRTAFPLDQTGFNAVFTDDLTKYRTLKVRILNGLHILMVLTGLPDGVETVADYVAHPEWGPWLSEVLNEEIIPSLDYDRGECEAYAEQVMDRFRNPFLNHRLADIALNKEDKVRVRVLPTVKAYKAKFGREPERISAALNGSKVGL